MAPLDPMAFVGAPMVTLAASLIATALAAIRVDPNVVLKAD